MFWATVVMYQLPRWIFYGRISIDFYYNLIIQKVPMLIIKIYVKTFVIR